MTRFGNEIINLSKSGKDGKICTISAPAVFRLLTQKAAIVMMIRRLGKH